MGSCLRRAAADGLARSGSDRGSDGRPAVVAVGGWMALSGYVCRVLRCGGRSFPGASLAFGRHALHAFGVALQPDGSFV